MRHILLNNHAIRKIITTLMITTMVSILVEQSQGNMAEEQSRSPRSPLLGLNLTAGTVLKTAGHGLKGAAEGVAGHLGLHNDTDDSWAATGRDIAAEATAETLLGEEGKGKESKLGKNAAGLVKDKLNGTIVGTAAGAAAGALGDAYDKHIGANLKGTAVGKIGREAVKGAVKGALKSGVAEAAMGKR